MWHSWLSLGLAPRLPLASRFDDAKGQNRTMSILSGRANHQIGYEPVWLSRLGSLPCLLLGRLALSKGAYRPFAKAPLQRFVRRYRIAGGIYKGVSREEVSNPDPGGRPAVRQTAGSGDPRRTAAAPGKHGRGRIMRHSESWHSRPPPGHGERWFTCAQSALCRTFD